MAPAGSLSVVGKSQTNVHSYRHNGEPTACLYFTYSADSVDLDIRLNDGNGRKT